MKYRQVSVKYNNQIVTTLRKGFKSDADSLLTQKLPIILLRDQYWSRIKKLRKEESSSEKKPEQKKRKGQKDTS
jgi:cell division protein FtsQ